MTMELIVTRRDLAFLLYDWLKVEELCTRVRFREHSRDTFDSILDACQKIAAEKFAPFNRIADTEEPRQIGDKVSLPHCSYEASPACV